MKIGISAPGEITVLRQELWHDEEHPWEQKTNGAASPNGGPKAASA